MIREREEVRRWRGVIRRGRRWRGVIREREEVERSDKGEGGGGEE